MQGSWHNHSVISAIINPCQSKDWQMKKTAVAHERNAENAKNSVSLASDERKTLKTARRLCFFIENCRKQHFACKR